MKVFILLLAGITGVAYASELDDPPPLKGRTELYPVATHYYRDPETLALMEDIIQCESGGDPTAQSPISTAYGYCQFLNGTWEYVQEKWDMSLVRESPKDQLYACYRLLDEEGTSHWYPSIECWSS